MQVDFFIFLLKNPTFWGKINTFCLSPKRLHTIEQTKQVSYYKFDLKQVLIDFWKIVFFFFLLRANTKIWIIDKYRTKIYLHTKFDSNRCTRLDCRTLHRPQTDSVPKLFWLKDLKFIYPQNLDIYIYFFLLTNYVTDYTTYIFQSKWQNQQNNKWRIVLAF